MTGLREDTYELCYNSACLSLAQDDIKEAEEKLKQAEGVKSSDKRWLTLGREYEWEGGGGGWVGGWVVSIAFFPPLIPCLW